MAEAEHLAKLLGGVKTWNAWRTARSTILPDLKGADLSGTNLSGAELSGADLSGVELIGAVLKRADLEAATLIGADLSGADFSEAKLRSATLSRADLSGAELSRADLAGAHLNDANLIGATLKKADLRRASFIRADLSGADLSGANLAEADLRDCELSYCSLAMANLTKATLSGARMDYTNLLGWKISGITCTHIVRGDKRELVHFRPYEFENKYRQNCQLFEIILEVELSELAYFVGLFTASSINEKLGSVVVQLKTLDAISEEHTKFVFVSFDIKFVSRSKELLNTVLRGDLNRLLADMERPSLLFPRQVMMYMPNGLEKEDVDRDLDSKGREAGATRSERIVAHYSTYLKNLEQAIHSIVSSVLSQSESPLERSEKGRRGSTVRS
jgi:uncharacterized protein YjbI with pentapeptide repeats